MSAGMILCYRARLRPAAFGRAAVKNCFATAFPQLPSIMALLQLAAATGLVGLCAALTDDTVCTIDAAAFDEDSGLRISIRGQPGFLPVSRPKWWLDHISL